VNKVIKKKIKGSCVLIVGAGSSVEKYQGKIEKFIKENNAVTIGINNINGLFIPDYHFWGSRRWEKFGKRSSDKSYFIFSHGFSKKSILKFGERAYFVLKDKHWSIFRNTGIMATHFSYIHGAISVNLVGMDGYTYYPYDDLKEEKQAQHCYGKGITDGQPYERGRQKDKRNYETLKSLYGSMKKKYKFGFEILTPTVYGEFYNSKILDISEKSKAIPAKRSAEPKINKRRFMKKSKYWL